MKFEIRNSKFGSFLLALLVLAVLLGVPFYRSLERPKHYQFGGLTMGTVYRVQVIAPGLGRVGYRDLCLRVRERLVKINRLMSVYESDSQLVCLNDYSGNEPFEVSSELYGILELALDIAEASGGAFDPTVGPLVDLWGFGPADRKDGLPVEEEINQCMENVGYSNVMLLSGNMVRKRSPGVKLDLGAIAKGYGADDIARLIRGDGITNFLVEVGGEVVAGGKNPRGDLWRVAIQDPDSGQGAQQAYCRILRLSEKAVATSGDYRNFREQEGARYSHVIDPRTGRPVTNKVASVTVIADDCMTADALATALMAVGSPDGIAMAEKYDNVEALILQRTPDNRLVQDQTSGFAEYLVK